MQNIKIPISEELSNYIQKLNFEEETLKSLLKSIMRENKYNIKYNKEYFEIIFNKHLEASKMKQIAIQEAIKLNYNGDIPSTSNITINFLTNTIMITGGNSICQE